MDSTALPSVVDVLMHGRPATTAAYVVRGSGGTALVDTGPAASLPATRAALARLGVTRLDWIVLTHVHLDHAGACGALAVEFPEARIAVHPGGARHVVDPSRLWRGVSAVYGDRTEALWGRPLPVPAARVHAIADGDGIDLGNRRLRALATPGHARHHHAWIEEAGGDAFVGDAVGMQVGRDELWRATTPPADFDLEPALHAIEALRTSGCRRLWLGHFGPATHDGDATAIDRILDRGGETLRTWTAAIEALRRADVAEPELTERVRAWLAEHERRWPPSASAALDATSDPAVDVAGVVGWLTARTPRTPGLDGRPAVAPSCP